MLQVFLLFHDICCHSKHHNHHNPFSPAPTYDLLVGNGDHVSQVHFEGTTSVTVRTNTTGNVVGVDFYAELVNTIVHLKWLITDVCCIFAANP